jgi:two-component system phosphate regulon sensor histidine kinase PhoR
MTDLKKHQLTALTGFIILIGVLFYLIYNTFELKERQYQQDVRQVLKRFFIEKSKGNIYPEAFVIVDKYLKKNILELELEYSKSGSMNNKYSNAMLSGLLEELRARNPLDSLFKQERKKYKLDNNIEYRIVVNSIKVRFKDNKPLPLYDQQKTYPFLNPNLQSTSGYVIGGTLNLRRSQNIVSSISLSPSIPYTYDINFTLFADRNSRFYDIFKSAIPVLLLTFVALASVFLIYYFTFQNWIKQKKLSEMKSDFVNSITHEFNTPIATIMVANRALQNVKVLESKESIAEFTEIIGRQSKRLQTLFDQVLDISQVKGEIEKTEVIFCQFLTEVIRDYRFKVTDENVTFHTQGMENESLVLLNKFWVTTMLINIFDNAIKYSDKVHKSIHVLIQQTPDGLSLRIKDNGLGMEDHIIRHVFDKFYRGNKPGKEHVSGLGLGMYYVQQCIRIHNWKLEVRSTVGLGSELVILI